MLSIKVKEVLPLKDVKLLVFFEDEKCKIFDVKELFKEYPEYAELKDKDLFHKVRVEPGGYGVSWNKILDLSEGELYNDGVDIPLTIDDFINFATNNLVTTADAIKIMGCTKQNIDDLIKRGKLTKINIDDKYNTFLKSDIEKRTWNRKE